MSEFSESFHIRADDPRQTNKRLAEARHAGLLFGPRGGWLTFVPYENAKTYRDVSASETAFAGQLARWLKTPVLRYFYAEDFGWGFSVTRSDGSCGRFACWWDPAPATEQDNLDIAALADILPATITPLLQPVSAIEAYRSRPAYQFAELLALPAYRWLSPRILQEDRDVKEGLSGLPVGKKPASVEKELALPPARKISLPRPELSAREALAAAKPYLRPLEREWQLTNLFGGGRLTPDGRLEAGVGLWDFRYEDTERRKSVRVWLHHNGSLSFRGNISPVPADPAATYLPLPNEWLDSTQIAEIAMREPLPEDWDQRYALTMSLRAWPDAPLVWEVRRFSTLGTPPIRLEAHMLGFEAVTGQILLETFERREHGAVLESRRRIRYTGGDWEKV